MNYATNRSMFHNDYIVICMLKYIDLYFCGTYLNINCFTYEMFLYLERIELNHVCILIVKPRRYLQYKQCT